MVCVLNLYQNLDYVLHVCATVGTIFTLARVFKRKGWEP